MSNKHMGSSRSGSITRKHVDDYACLQDILDEVELISKENLRLTQVNTLYDSYISKRITIRHTHTGLTSSEQQKEFRKSLSSSCINRSMSSSTRGSLTSLGLPLSRSFIASSEENIVTRLNITCLLDMVEREMEDNKILIENIRMSFLSTHFLLQAEEENLKTNVEMIQTFKTSFDNFIKGSTDKKTGRVTIDKFSRFLDSENRNQNKNLRKIKLKKKTFESELNQMKQQQQQKSELRVHLHSVDLDKLRIENQHLLKVLEGKTKMLMNLKIKLGKKGQQIVLLKSKTDAANCELKRLEQSIQLKEAKCAITETKETQNLNDLMAAELTKKTIKQIFKTCKSPDIFSYIQVEIEISELKKEKEIWERRLHNTKQTANSLEHQLKHLSNQVGRQM